MESTYLYYPAKRALKVLHGVNWHSKGYILVHSDPESKALILRRNYMIFKKAFFEIKVSNSKEDICGVSVEQIYSHKTDPALEQKLIREILKLF